jgi:predicted esterase
MSTIRHAPAQEQQESWKRLWLRKDKILIITGSSDPIIKAKELKEDVLELVGADKLEWRLIDGAHDIPTSDPGRTVNEICSFWKI